MELRLRGKVCWITGASGGIGRAIAETFAAEGAELALHAHSGTRGLEQWLATTSFARGALVLEADLRSAEALEKNAEAIVERFGRIDVLCANAGVWPPGDHPLHELPLARLRDTVEVDLLGALYTARAFLRALARTGPREDGDGASIVFTGSTAGKFGERDHLDYAVAKAGLVGAVKTLKNEMVALDPCGRVNLVQPGWTATHMARPALEVEGTIERVVSTMPLQQLGRADDIAQMVAFLSSPRAARHVTGEVVTVAGGMEGRRLWEAGDVDENAVRAKLHED